MNVASTEHGPVTERVMASNATSAASPDAAEANLALLFRQRSAAFATAPRWRQRTGGSWCTATYAENQRLVNRLIAGLAALGARRGDVIGILAGTRWEWLAADWAILGLGGVTTMIYASNIPATVGTILRDSGARYLFLENRAQYDKVMQADREPGAIHSLILFDDDEAVADDLRVISFEALQRLSPLSDEQADAFAAECAASIQPDDVVSIVYTSGTTGVPKGVVHTHRTLLAQVVGVRAMLPMVHAGMRDTLFLPLSHVLGRLESFYTLDRGAETTIVPSLDVLAEELRQAHPDIILGVPRVYEKAYAAIESRMRAGSLLQRRVARWAQLVGRTASTYREHGERLPLHVRLQYAIADRLVLRQVREAFGGHVQFAITGGAPLDVEILRFFHGCGIPLLEGWGLTETGGAYTVNRPDGYRLGTVGQAFPGHEIRIAADGEVLLRGPCLFLRYHNNPEATAEAFDADGWFHTGDIGALDTDGFLRIVDRKKELIVTAGGKKIAPQYVEHLLQTIPVVSQVCVYGDRKPYLVALLTLNPDAVSGWARQHGVAPHSNADVQHSPLIRAYLERKIAAVNAQLASYEQVKYFDVLDEDFTVENGLATPTLKIRRRQIVARYLDRFEALYRPTPSRWGADEQPPPG